MFERKPVTMVFGRAAVVEESVLQRKRTEQLLAEEIGLETVCSCATLTQLIAWIRVTERSGWPGFVVLGIPHDAGQDDYVTAMAELRRVGIRVLVVSALRTSFPMKQLLATGPDGVVSTTDSEHDFVATARAVLRGGTALAPRVQNICELAGTEPRLSDQEHRVFVLYSSGLEIIEVAAAIGVRPDTARKYLKRVREKYAKAGIPAGTKLELARIAWSQGYGRTPVHGLRGA